MKLTDVDNKEIREWIADLILDIHARLEVLEEKVKVVEAFLKPNKKGS